MIDLKLLMFWPGETGKERNKKEAIDVIRAELATCLFVERFEFFQKILVLNLWLCQESIGESRDKVQELVNMHLPNIKSED